MDNKIFNVNGKGLETLKKALDLACNDHTKIEGWKFDKDKGLILYWAYEDKKGMHKLPSPLDSNTAAELAFEWLKGPEAASMEFSDWDEDTDHDGVNEKGWRVYVEDWGHIGGDWRAICAVRPAYIWYGK